MIARYRRFRALWQPELYHGWGRKRRFFEGWYYKLISPDERHALAIIPGIAMDEKGESQAFIQVLDGKRMRSAYHAFPAEDFHMAPDRFELDLQANRFSPDALEVELPEATGSLRFEDRVRWPSSLAAPGIMGWYGFVPFMECYHGILAMDSRIRGSLNLDGQSVDFDGGRAYMEKDWGQSFPSSWIWTQSNHFAEEGVSVKASIARIPWLRSWFVGFICGLLIDGRIYRFATYTGAVLDQLKVSDDEVRIRISDRRHRLEINALRADGGELAAPVQGLMAGRVVESMEARIALRLTERSGAALIYQGEGRNAGLEVAGTYEELLTS